MKWQQIPWGRVGNAITNSFLGSTLIGMLLDFIMMTSISLSFMVPVMLGWVTEEPFRTNLVNFSGALLLGGYMLFGMKYLLRKYVGAEVDSPLRGSRSAAKDGLRRFSTWLMKLENSVAPFGMLIVLSTIEILCLDFEKLPTTDLFAAIYIAIHLIIIVSFCLYRMQRAVNGASVEEQLVFGVSPSISRRMTWLITLGIAAICIIHLGSEFIS